MASIYQTVPEDVSDIDINNFQMIVLFSPYGIESLVKNFPDYKQDETILAAFGESTIKACEDAGFDVHIKAPTVEAPSMTMAIELFLSGKGKK